MGRRGIIALLMSLVLVVGLFPSIALATDGNQRVSELKAQDSLMTEESETQACISLERDFENNQNNRFYEGDTAMFKVNINNMGGVEGSDWDLVIKVGQFRTFNDETGEFEHSFTAGNEFSFDKKQGIITIDTTKALDKLSTWDGPSVCVVRARIINSETKKLFGDSALYEAIDSIELRADYINLDRKWDRDMLPGWDDWINSTNVMHVDTSAVRERDLTYEVKDVKSDDDAIVSVEEQEGGWRLFAKNCGTATLTVTYKNPEELGGSEGEYQFKINVSKDVYDAWIETELGSSIALPGKSINLIAECKHDYNDDSENAEEKFTYDWSFDQDTDIAEIIPDSNDSRKATVTFKELEQDDPQGGVWDEVCVRVVVKGANDKERTSADINLSRASEYTDILPVYNNKKMVFGETETIEPKVYSYSSKYPDGSVINASPKFSWENVNTEVMQILDESGNEIEYNKELSETKFIIKRLKNDNTEFNLVATWGEDGRAERYYCYDELNTNIQFNSDCNRVYSDGSLDLNIEIDDAFDPKNIEYTVGLWNGEANNGEGAWEEEFEQGDGWTVINDNKAVKLDGAKLLAKEKIESGTWIRVCAELIINGEVISSNDYGVEVREAQTDYTRVEDRSMLPGWDGRIDAASKVWVENSKNPDGKEFEYEITEVEVESSNPSEVGKTVLAIQKKTDDGDYWLYTAQNHGTAIVKVTYEIPEELGGGTDSYTFTISVCEDVYEMKVDVADNGLDTAGPGGTINLSATATHYQESPSGETASHTIVPLNNPKYEWKFRDEESNDFATIESNGDTAIVQFKPLPEGEHERFEDVWVEVRLFENGGEKECAYKDICLHIETRDINNCDFKLVTKDKQGKDIYAGVENEDTWALIFLKGKDVTFTPTVELYDGGALVDSRNYTVKYEKTWWEGDDEKSEIVDTIKLSDKQGQCNYRIVIQPVDGSCYRGTYKNETAEIQAVDEYDLDSSYTDMYFETQDGKSFSGVVDDRINGMNPNYHVVPAAIAEDYLNGFKLRTGGDSNAEVNLHKGHLLTLNTDYRIKYYKVDPSKRTAEITIDGSMGDPLSEAPTTPGSYMLVVEGDGQYSGRNWVLFDIQANADDISIESIPDQKWTGNKVEPKVTVTYKGQTIDPSLYKVEFKNNINEGEALISFSGNNPILHWSFNPEKHGVEMIPDTADRFFNAVKSVKFKIAKPVYASSTYEWANDNKTIVAKRVCTNFDDLTITENGRVTSKVTKPATCTEKGETTYTATFQNAAFASQTKVLADIPAQGHKWEAPTYIWDSKNVSVTATRICTNNAAHNQTETASTTSKTTKATLTKAGKIVYMTTNFNNTAFAKQEKTTIIAKNNMKISSAKKTVKFSKVKRKTQSVNAITVHNNKGSLTYSKKATGSSKCLSVKKSTGKITVKKGTKKGTYTIKVKITSAATAQYAAVTKTVSVKVTVK